MRKNNKLEVKRPAYELLAKSPRWPRVKGPAASRIDCTTGYAAKFLRSALVLAINNQRGIGR